VSAFVLSVSSLVSDTNFSFVFLCSDRPTARWRGSVLEGHSFARKRYGCVGVGCMGVWVCMGYGCVWVSSHGFPDHSKPTSHPFKPTALPPKLSHEKNQPKPTSRRSKLLLPIHKLHLPLTHISKPTPGNSHLKLTTPQQLRSTRTPSQCKSYWCVQQFLSLSIYLSIYLSLLWAVHVMGDVVRVVGVLLCVQFAHQISHVHTCRHNVAKKLAVAAATAARRLEM
jgi:hypothetical protein